MAWHDPLGASGPTTSNHLNLRPVFDSIAVECTEKLQLRDLMQGAPTRVQFVPPRGLGRRAVFPPARFFAIS